MQFLQLATIHLKETGKPQQKSVEHIPSSVPPNIACGLWEMINNLLSWSKSCTNFSQDSKNTHYENTEPKKAVWFYH